MSARLGFASLLRAYRELQTSDPNHYIPQRKARRRGEMAKGLYKDAQQWVMVDYGSHRARVQKTTYEANGYKPPYQDLPTEDQYRASDKGAH